MSTQGRKPRSRRFSLAALALALASVLLAAGCDHDLIDDATFRLGCGDSLCAWSLDAGHVRRAPTWHKNDHGVELVDTPTTISQVLKDTARCLKFTTVADVDASAQVTVGIDINSDGELDYEQPIAAVGFREVKTEVTAPRTPSLIMPRISITKKGHGKAVLAQIRLQGNDDCTAPALRLKNRPLGDSCTQGDPSECASGVCCEGICAECCVDPQAPDFLDHNGRLVDTTPRRVACPGNGVCERRDVERFRGIFQVEEVVPLQCDPGRRLRSAGAVCLADDDCASNTCEGASSLADRGGDKPGDPRPACEQPDFLDAGRPDCVFRWVREGRCR
jgi:hypothetical protein